MAAKKLVLLLLFSLLLGKGLAAESGIKLVESSAFIKNNGLQVEMMFSNSSAQQGQVTINVNYIGHVETVIEAVPGNSAKIFTYKISNVRAGEVKFAVFADHNAFIKVTVPENPRENSALLVRGITNEEWKIGLPDANPLSSLGVAFDHLLRSPDALAVATVLLIAVAALLALKVALRKKTTKEKKVESNEQLLKEAKEIEEKRKRVKRKFKL